jgi:hypothetical protein
MNNGVNDYIDKQKSPQKEICLALRKIIQKTYPGISEEMKWGVPVYDGGKFYIGAVKFGVNLGFSMQGLTEEQMNRFNGKGVLMRHIKIMSEDKINEKEITELLHLVKRS